MNLIDSHCHLNRLQPEHEQEAQIISAQTSGVEVMLSICVDFSELERIIALCEKHENIYASVGFHPGSCGENEPESADIIEYAQKSAKIIAVGETGLDFHYLTVAKDIQKTRFRAHIRAANRLNLPLVIHSRQARKDTINIMREEQATNGIMHCFTEDIAMAKQALDLGFYISFSGIITFKNGGEIREVAKYVPLERILIETDSPYLAPVPYRGKANRPEYVALVNEKLAQIRGMRPEETARITSRNFRRLFNKSMGAANSFQP